MSLKKILISMLCAVCAISLLAPVAFAHCGHGRGARGQVRTYSCAVCTAPDCELTGRHYHNGVMYCGFHHENGFCDGTCAPLCPVEGCTLTGRHYHDGAVYCGANHTAGYCDGTCGYSRSAHTWGGCHGGARRCGW